MYTYNYSYGYSLGYSGGYNPYINYTWQMLPNAKVKNSGTSGVDLQLYSGNPLDFQGSQAVVVDDVNSTNFDIRNDFTVLLACKPSGTNNSLFGNNTLDTKFLLVTRYNDSIGTRIAYNDTVYKFKDIETEAEHLSYKCLGITKSGTTLTFYWNGEVTATYTNISLPSVNFFNNLILGSREVGSSAYDGAYDNFYLFDSVLDADTIKKHTEYPNDFYQDMVNDNRTLFCTDFRGTAGYIADDRNVSKANTNITPSMVDTSWTNNLDGSYTSDGTSSYLKFSGITIGKYYEISFDTFFVSGTLAGYINAAWDWNLTSGTKHSFILYANSSLLNFYSATFSGTVSNIKAIELSAVYPITNYSETMRTNFQTETTGLQDLTRSFDSLGFYTGVTDFLNCNGVGYGDTGWIINPSDSQDFSLELIAFAPLLEDRTTQTTICGKLNSGSSNAFNIKTNIDNRCFVSFGSITTTFIPTIGQYFHLTVVKLSAPNSYSVFLNGVIDTESPKDSSFWSSDYQTSILLGGAWTSTTTKETSYKSGIRLFKVHNKALTQEEITKNYNSYVAQGLLQ